MKTNTLAVLLAAGASALAAGAAQAQVAGTMSLKLGVNQITPHVTSDDLTAPALPGSKIDIKSASSLLLTATYSFTDAVTLELLAGLPYKHDIVGAGAIAGVGKIGSIQQISPTLVLQYRLLGAESTFRPYVGAGLTYAMFYGSEGSATLTALTNPGGQPTLIGSDKSMGYTVQLGGTVKIDSHWYADISVLKTYVATTAPIDTAPVNNGQSIHAKLDPMSANLSIGYRF